MFLTKLIAFSTKCCVYVNIKEMLKCFEYFARLIEISHIAWEVSETFHETILKCRDVRLGLLAEVSIGEVIMNKRQQLYQ